MVELAYSRTNSAACLPVAAIAIPIYASLLLPILAVRRHDTHDILVRTAKVHLALLLTAYCISYAPALLLQNIPGFETKGARRRKRDFVS